jgi:GAF domain-containing protein
MSFDPQQRRLDALHQYDILDTFPEARFERITRLATTIFGTPISAITLLDEERQWFKSHPGLDLSETPLDISFCKHAIEQEDVLTIPDTTKDDRFSKNTLVTGDPGIRFYAGAPLRTPEGVPIGALCVIDTIPRPPLKAIEEQMLTDLAALVMDELELRTSKHKERTGS